MLLSVRLRRDASSLAFLSLARLRDTATRVVVRRDSSPRVLLQRIWVSSVVSPLVRCRLIEQPDHVAVLLLRSFDMRRLPVLDQVVAPFLRSLTNGSPVVAAGPIFQVITLILLVFFLLVHHLLANNV